MKEVPLYCAGPAYYRMCSTERLLFGSNRQRAPGKPSPIISSFLELGRKKTVDAAKICGGAENVVKTRASKR